MQTGAAQTAINAVSKKSNPYAATRRCTSPVRQAILHARSEAAQRGEVQITACDLLAGLCEQEDTRAERIGNLKNNATYLRWLCNLAQHPWTEPVAASSVRPSELDADAQRALAYAIAEADRDGEHWIDSDHLLRGLIRFPNRAQSALFNIELHLTGLREASFHDRDQYEPEDNPNVTTMETLVGKHIPYLAPRLLVAACYVYIFMDIFSAGLSPFLAR